MSLQSVEIFAVSIPNEPVPVYFLTRARAERFVALHPFRAQFFTAYPVTVMRLDSLVGPSEYSHVNGNDVQIMKDELPVPDPIRPVVDDMVASIFPDLSYTQQDQIRAFALALIEIIDLRYGDARISVR